MDGLTRFEVYELFYMARDSAASDFSVLLTLLSAFLVVAYFSAKKLTMFQLIAVTAIYTASYFYVALGYYFALDTAMETGAYLAGWEASVWWRGMAVVVAVAWLLSIIFMIQARIRKDT